MSDDEIQTKPLSDSPHVTLISPSGQRLHLFDKGSAWQLICVENYPHDDPPVTWLSFAKDGKLSKLAKFIIERDEFSMYPKPQENNEHN